VTSLAEAEPGDELSIAWLRLPIGRASEAD
jgi:hypothetical protein